MEETELTEIREKDAAKMRDSRRAALLAQQEAVKSTQAVRAESTQLANMSRPAAWNWEDMDFDDEKTGGLSLKEWAELDLGAVALMGVRKFVKQRPILTSVWVFGLLLACLAGGFPVDETSREAYNMLRNHSDAIDTVEFSRAFHELRRSEARYYTSKGFWSCDENCTRAYDQVQMAGAELTRVSKRRDQALAEARGEVGIWSSVGVQDVRDSFWSAWKAGKDFAARMSWWDAMFMTVGRDEPVQQVIIRMVMKYAVNLSLGLITCFCYFMYSLYVLIISYGSSLLSGLAFFLLAVVAGLSVLSAYLGTLYGVIGTGYMMYQKQNAIRQALEGAERQHMRLEGKHVRGRPAGVRCPV